MASTFWAELYFRSLNPNDVLDQLTKYLVQYKRVSIPAVGTILLVQRPSELNVADKTILPPSFTAQLNEEDAVPEHQLQFLAGSLKEEKETVLARLQDVGNKLKKQVNSDGFEWQGIGTIRRSDAPVTVSLPALQPLSAERVLRQNAEHNVLVGDQQMTSTQIAGLREEELEEGRKTKRSVLVIIGWIILLLSILYIIFILYQGKFRVGATGSKYAPTGLLYKFGAPKTGVLFQCGRQV